MWFSADASRPESMPRLIAGHALAFGLTLGAILWLGWSQFATAVYPVADLAADMLLGDRITRGDLLLTGQYSRFGFHHPGPFFFYVHHAVELLLAPLHWTRQSVWVLTSVTLNALFLVIASSLACLSLGIRRDPLSLCLFCACALSLIGQDLYSPWMPPRLEAPYLALLFGVILLQRRHLRLLPLVVGLACVLVHGHVALVLFALLPLSVSLLFGLWRRPGPLDPRERRSFVLAAVVAGTFALPIALDLLLHDPSNLSMILAAVGVRAGSSLPETVRFGWTLSTDGLNAAHGGLLVAGAGATLLSGRRKQTSGLLATLGGVSLLFLLFYSRAPRPLMPFMAFFFRAAPASLICAALLLLIGRPAPGSVAAPLPPRARLGAAVLGVLLLIGTFTKQPRPLTQAIDEAYIGVLAEIAQGAAREGDRVAIGYAEHPMWRVISGVLLELQRRGMHACSARQDMDFLFTPERTCAPGQPPDVVLVHAEDCSQSCLGIVEGFGLVASRLHPGSVQGFDATEAVTFQGWSSPEDNFRWSLGEHAEILFRTADADHFTGRLKLSVGSLGQQRVVVLLNQVALGQVLLDGPTRQVELFFDPDLLRRGGRNQLEFNFPTARAPGASDPRRLALRLIRFSID